MAFSLDARVASRPRSVGGAGLAVFTFALFVSALLLFALEPIVTKLLLPLLGGSASVWSVAMVFFQATLLAGYCYAHLLVRFFSLRTAAIIHLALLAMTALALPIGIASGWGRPPVEGEALWLMALLCASVGLPFFAVAGTGPLLQAWFFRSGHTHAADPYFLYGASNFGSFAALLLYPVLIEPMMSLYLQRTAWSFGFISLVVLIGTCALIVLAPAEEHAAAAPVRTAPIAWRARLTWTILAFVPSALLVAVTAHISTDIASAPLLWVVPLALYLLTFIIAFQRRPIIPHRLVLKVLPIAIVPLVVLIAATGEVIWIGAIFVHLGFFFLAALACHGEMVRLRPPADHLTEFYMWMSTGGVIGGIFSGLIAPQIFSSVVEYPILLIASLAALPALRGLPPRVLARQLLVAAAVVLLVLLPGLLGWRPSAAVYAGAIWAGLFFITFRDRPALLCAALAGILMIGAVYPTQLQRAQNFRSFFGVNRVAESVDGRFRVLLHGTTLHGAERIRNDDGTPYVGAPSPATYYSRDGLMSEVVASVRNARGTLAKVAVVGLGTGSLACHSRPGEQWVFYEIDPVVVTIARDPSKFDFLARCTPQAPIIVGDARQTLSDDTDSSYDLIILDAFSSDAVPVHLLTQEAVTGYLAKLAPGGVILFHISNRYMDLAPVLAASGASNGLTAIHGFTPSTENGLKDLISGSEMVAMARSQDDLADLATGGRWKPIRPDPSFREWTDDYSNVVAAIVRRLWPAKAGI
jgi:hypothetical protein